jgi:hypothetical protein
MSTPSTSQKPVLPSLLHMYWNKTWDQGFE